MNGTKGSDRSQECPVCKRKLTICHGKHGRLSLLLPGILCALVLLCVLVAGIMARQPEIPTSSPIIDSVKTYEKIGQEYFLRHPEDWWHLHDGRNIPEADILIIKSELETMSLRVIANVARFRSVNESTERIAMAFPSILPSFYNGGSVKLSAEAQDMNALQQGIELCCITEADAVNPQLEPNLIWYRREWGALMLRAVDIPDPVLTAVVYHELWHALADRERRAPPTFEEFVQEEIEAHDQVETPVLNAITGGRFSALLTMILKRKEGVEGNPEDIITLIRKDDLMALDAMLQMQGSGKLIARTMYAQFVYALLALHADQSANPLQEKMRVYQWPQRRPR